MAEPSKATFLAMHSLAVDRDAAQIVEALRRAGLETVLLKGGTLAEWLYGQGEEVRSYGDTDVLVDPACYEQAERVLAAEGFEPAEPEEWGTSEFQPHARAWRHRERRTLVDLHRALPGLRDAAPERVWAELRHHRDTQRLGGLEVTVLDVPARLLLVVLHLRHHALYEHHEQPTAKAARDLERAVAVAGEDEWRAAMTLAERLGAGAQFAEGLRMDERGAVLAEGLGTLDRDLLSRTGPGSATPLVIGFERLARAEGVRAKLALAVREVVPPRSQMRYDSRLARRGGWLGLLIAYVRRVGHVARYALPSWRAWRRLRSAPSRADAPPRNG